MSGSAILEYEQAMAMVIDRVDDDAPVSFGGSGSFTPRVTVIRRPSASAPWAPTPPRPSGPQPRAALPHLDEPAAASHQAAIALPPELEASFRTLCALRAVEPARVLQGLVRSYVILGLAQGVKP